MYVCCVFLLQSLLVAQQLANVVGGVMSGAGPGMNQPILIPFNAGGQQGLVLSLPTANIQSLVAAAAAGGIMTLPLQNLQGKKKGSVDKQRQQGQRASRVEIRK